MTKQFSGRCTLNDETELAHLLRTYFCCVELYDWARLRTPRSSTLASTLDGADRYRNVIVCLFVPNSTARIYTLGYQAIHGRQHDEAIATIRRCRRSCEVEQKFRESTLVV